MTVKLTLLAIFVACAHSLALSQQITTATDHYVGTANNWVNYGSDKSGLYVEVNFADLGLQKTPQVFTYLTCTSHCWDSSGATSIYELDNKHFRVYVRRVSDDYTLDKDFAATNKWVLNYRILNMDFEWEWLPSEIDLGS